MKRPVNNQSSGHQKICTVLAATVFLLGCQENRREFQQDGDGIVEQKIDDRSLSERLAELQDHARKAEEYCNIPRGTLKISSVYDPTSKEQVQLIPLACAPLDGGNSCLRQYQKINRYAFSFDDKFCQRSVGGEK